MSIFGIFGERWKRFSSYFPILLKFEQLWESRGEFKYIYLEEKEWSKIQDDVKIHKVSSSVTRLATWIKDLKKAEQYEEKEGLNQVFMYFHLIKSAKHLESVLKKLVEHVREGKIERNAQQRIKVAFKRILPQLIGGLVEVQQWGQKDMKDLMAVINKAVEQGSANFVINLRQAFKDARLESRLEKVMERMGLSRDIRGEHLERSLLEKCARELSRIDTSLKSNMHPKMVEKRLAEFETLLNEAEKHLIAMYRDAHLIMKREALLMMIVLSDEDVIKALGPRWVQANFMPEVPVSNSVKDVQKLEKQLADKAHMIANGLNVILKDTKRLQDEFVTLLKAA